jgi:hypothetical protein
MSYQLFYTDVPLPVGQNHPDYSRLMPFAFQKEDLAIEAAFRLMEQGAIVWRIDGPDGYQMTRSEIERKYREVHRNEH